MVVGEKIRKFLLKLGLGYLPWLAMGTSVGFAYHNSVNYNRAGKSDYEINYDFSKIMLPLTVAMAGSWCLGAYGSYLSRKRRVVIEEHKGIDKIFDYPGIVSAAVSGAMIGAASTVVGLNKDSFLNYLANKDPAVYSAYAVCAGVGAYASLQSLLSFFSLYKSPIIKNGSREFIKLFKDTPLTSSSFSNYATESELSLADKAKACINEGRKLDALYYWNSSLQMRQRTSAIEEALASNFVEKVSRAMVLHFFFSKNSKELKKSPENLSLLVQRQFLHMAAFQYDKVRQVSEKILSNSGCSDEERVLQSFIYDTIGDSASANMIRHEVLPSLINRQYRIGQSLVFSKPGTKERLAGEAGLLDSLQRSCEKFDFEAARPLGIWDSMGKSWLFEVFSDGTSLHDYLDKTPDVSVLKKAALAQAALHTLVPFERKFFVSDDITSFLGRVPESWMLNKGLLNHYLVELINPLGGYLSADCDGHRQNRNYNSSRQITVYDLEPRGDAPMSFDYAKLLRQGRWVGSWAEQKQILAECADLFNKNKNQPDRVNPELLAEQVLKASPYKALRYAVFALSKPEKHNIALNFLGNAENDIQMLDDKGLVSRDCCHALSEAVATAEYEIITANENTPPRTFL
jgi:hypothetical protein